MKDKKSIIEELELSTKHILRLTGPVSQEHFNLKQPGQWSVADCIEHLYLLEKLILGVMQGKTKDPEIAADQKTTIIENVFSDFERKLNAPSPIAPTAGDKEKESCMTLLISKREAIARFIENSDLAALCLDFSHRFFGELTRYEWIYFIIHHSNRHLKQIERITSA